MIKMYGNLLTLLILIFLISCGKSELQIKEEKDAVLKQKEEQLKTTNEKAATILSKKYNAQIGWDTLDLYTYLYQEMFIDQRNPISFEGKLEDIIKLDSSYILKVLNTNRTYIAQISMNRERFVEFQKIFNSKNRGNEGCFVFQVSKIISASPEIKSDYEFDGEGSYSFLDYDFDQSLLIFKGDLIDFYVNETDEKDNY